MGTSDNARLEQLLDWLAEAVAARLPAGAAAPHEGPLTATAAVPVSGPGPEEAAPAATGAEDASELAVPAAAALTARATGPALTELPAPAPAAPSHAAGLLSRLAIGLLAVVVLINVPLPRQGTAIARMIPSSTSLVIRDGLLVKEEGSPDVYVYRGGAFHWITDLDVFAHAGYRWQNVHEVKPGFLAGFELGRPVYLLAKCPTSPHIYRLQGGAKRWIVDIATLEAEGYEWADVQMMDCYRLRDIPDGETIPPGRGPAPQP